VVQRNLVYVTGLTPTLREDQLLQTLRGDEYFGQYGKIIKIVVSKAKDTSHGQQSVGVYVTFAKREDAAKCINAVDGSQNGDRVLRYVHGIRRCSGLANISQGRSTVRRNTALLTFEASIATTEIACFSTSQARKAKALLDRTCLLGML
jgi:hypothetical protein